MLKGERKILSDTETTGLDFKEDRVIEIGAVEIIGNVITGNYFHEFINPGRKKVSEDAFKIHGISDEFLANKPPFADVIARYERFLGTDPVVFHNANFDRRMFQGEYQRLKRPMFSNPIEDSLIQAQNRFPGQQNSLDALCRRFKIDNSGRELHGALLDSRLLAEVYIELHELNRLNLTPHESEVVSAVRRLSNNDISGSKSPIIETLAISPEAAERAKHEEFLSKFIKNAIWKEFS